ncbi:hypothetical protein PTTG_01647 [Puccinia triticina 1-1 BBBD Race 1]|uniref:Uncharacterized protein n=2 Tax=Puccinia triticina TaxID=208348 RepID=A0A180GND9_PUCT1|nr:uncharacterized protein PtA15_16A283 [Puccinia triticina]OAV93822.1 hypothetical protein PTTG_01647 [Puccinia triticina 1-1 BBBD Race 1]WAQ92376.1 hypothetical protein PtA15_16A283 [Puccinia triticina]WAR64113.1 hypothetical protein PtB15_16B273 [Puccinia triticina]
MDPIPGPDWFHVPLPWPLSYFPSIFRFLSLVYIAPIILLSVIDVGGYLLFKLFYKPFGNYPMYSYFKQAPPREDGDSEPNSPRMKEGKTVRRECTSSSSEASSTLSSPMIQPTIRLDSGPFGLANEDEDSHQPVPLQRRNSSLRRRGSKKSKKTDQAEAHRHLIGFEGPMLDFKSPTASDYEE